MTTMAAVLSVPLTSSSFGPVNHVPPLSVMIPQRTSAPIACVTVPL